MISVQGKFRGPYPTAAQELCVEILSPGDTSPKALEKADRYIDSASHCVSIIDPEKRTAWTFSRERTHLSESNWIAPGGVLRIGERAIELDVLFSEVDRKLDMTDSRN